MSKKPSPRFQQLVDSLAGIDVPCVLASCIPPQRAFQGEFGDVLPQVTPENEARSEGEDASLDETD